MPTTTGSKIPNGIQNRIVVIAVILGLCLFGWFAVRTQIGDMLGELTKPSDEFAGEVAEVAIGFAPSAPRPWWLSAMVYKKSFAPEDIEKSVTALEESTRRTPNDYRVWTELARGYEQSERFAEAEAAFRRSIELAPAYAIPHWQFGNFLLRQDRIEEAKAELKIATETSSAYRDQVFALAWDYFGKDPAVVEGLASDSADARVNLAKFFAYRDRGADALRVWNTLSPIQKQYYETIARTTAWRLYENGFVRESLAIARDVGIAKDALDETVNNGGFEKTIGDHNDTLFGWLIFRNDSKFEAIPDSQIKAEGKRSLKVAFRNYSKPTLYNVAQIVTVESGKKYRLTFKLRTDNLKTGGAPYLEVAAVKTNQILAASDPFPIGSQDWQEVALEFTVPDGVEGSVIRTVRAGCGDECPISGTLWYDDFKLTRI